MPYKVQKSGKGYKVVTQTTGKAHSNHPISKSKALAQLRALYANTKDIKTPHA